MPFRKSGQSWVRTWVLISNLSTTSSWSPHAGRDEGPMSEPDETLVDECCLLPSQLLIPSLDWLPVSDGLVSRLQPKQPLRLHFGRAPILPGSATTLQLDGLIRCVPSALGPLHVPSRRFLPNLPESFFHASALGHLHVLCLLLPSELDLNTDCSVIEFPPHPLSPCSCHFPPPSATSLLICALGYLCVVLLPVVCVPLCAVPTWLTSVTQAPAPAEVKLIPNGLSPSS